MTLEKLKERKSNMTQLTVKDLDRINHPDLRKFAIDEGIKIPEEIKTKKDLVPFLFEQLQSKEQQEAVEETKEDEEQVAKETIEEFSAASDELEVSAEKVNHSVSEIKAEEPDEFLGRVRYIDTPTANGIMRYDRKTHSSTLVDE